MTINELAKELKVSKNTVKYHIKKLGVQLEKIDGVYQFTETTIELVSNSIRTTQEPSKTTIEPGKEPVSSFDENHQEPVLKPGRTTDTTEDGNAQNNPNFGKYEGVLYESINQSFETLQDTINLLKTELEQKDKVISSLTDQLQIKDHQISSLTVILDQEQKLNACNILKLQEGGTDEPQAPEQTETKHRHSIFKRKRK